MFNFFKRKGGKPEAAPATADDARKFPNPDHTKLTSVTARAQRNDTEHEKFNTIRKDVVNLLLPETDYNNQKTGVGAILQIMAGKRKRGKRRNVRTESCRISPLKETNVLQRSNSDRKANDVVVPTQAKNNSDDADFVKALVLQKYSKSNENKEHVSLVYVNEPDLEEKKHAEALLREIARTIDCTVDKLNESKQMGGTDSKIDRSEPLYESIDERNLNYRNELKGELDKLLNTDGDNNSLEPEGDSPGISKKSNLKPPKSDTEGCSDDDRSDCGKKRVTFRKHIVFDDGEQQTDEEVGSSFESLSSEDEEFLEDADDIIFADNTTVINVNDCENDNEAVTIKVESPETLKRISSDNSDSGFIEIGDKSEVTDKLEECEESESESEAEVSGSETEEEIIEEIIEEEISISEPFHETEEKPSDDQKTLVSQESKFQSQVASLTELADNRCDEAERARELLSAYRKEIEEKDQEIEQLKCELASAYKESELIRQRSRSLEEELSAARTCSSNLADQLHRRNDESLRQIRAELEDALGQRAELESRVLALERDKDRLEQEKVIQEQKAQEALAAAEACTSKWRSAHEAARSQAAARAERMLTDCEWKMRELEKKSREADKHNKELTAIVHQLKSDPKPSPAQVAELQQLRGLVTEEQRSVQSLTLQLQRVETREEALKLEVHRLKELLDRETVSGKEKEERYRKEVQRLEQQHTKTVEALRSEHNAAAASTRAVLERSHAERTRNALAQLRAEADQDARNADRKLREVTTRFENLKEVLAAKESQFEHAIAEAHGKADWDIMQLRHMLDKADITYANKCEEMSERFEREKESLIEEWSEKVSEIEEQASTAAEEAKNLLETTRLKLIAERMEQVNKLKEQHRQEMDDQWEQFMEDKENCLARMKTECRQEGEEDRVKREKELIEEIAELKSQLQSQSSEYDHLAVKAAACGRTLAVTEQELREALAREKELRQKRSEDATKIKQAENASKDQIEHLTRKCACLRKLFDDIRARLTARERAAEQESKAKDKELHQLRGEVARLTKILFEQNTPKLGARTRADGCETAPPEETPAEPRRKGFILTSKIEGDFRRVGVTPKNDNRNFNYFHTLSGPTEEKLRTMNKIEEYKKRAGTSGIQGQLYETKLISLIYFRLKHDENVDQFSLATNRDDIGAFDDICFKAKLKGINKPITVFIQAKHRENDKLLTFNSKTELAKYFDSYLDIRRAFDPSSKDMIFGRKFDETECFFVMYTTAKDDPSNKAYEGSFADILDELIGTGGSCTQPSYRNEDLDFLCKIVMKEQITTLVEQIAKFICDGSDSEMSMNNDLMLRYHVILALNVLHVSEIQPEGHRIANFRQDLFTTNEEFLVLIKNMLCLEVLKKRKSEETVEESLLTKFISEPSEITTLSKLIGSVLTYKNGKLEFVSKSTTDDLKRQLDKANVPESAVFEAAELAAKEYLLSLKLKVPALFGNKDLAIRGKPERIEKRLKYLTSKIIEIFEQSKCNNIVTIDESLEDGFLQLNGGIASAVGNILVFDETSKLLKFTDNCESLGNIAKTWYETLKSKIENLHEYKLDVKVKKFPKLSFDRGEYDVTLVRDFYDKLLFYTNQADQSSVAELLKGEIEDHPCNDVTSFRVRSDVIFLKYHDEIQKLWMTPKVGTYLTKKSKIYEDAVTSAMSETLMGILNIMYNFKNKDYIFNEDAIKRLESHEQNLRTVIATGSCVFTVAKVKQYLGNEKKDHVVLDLDDIFKLPLKSQNTLCKELTNATKDKILIIVCNNFHESGNSRKKLENIAKTIVNKQIIIITNKVSVEIITKYFPKASNILNDDKIVFTDMTVESQKKLLATSKLKFQGENLSLDKIVDDENAKLICEDVLNQIIDNETIVIGKTVVDYNYNKAKPFYVDRRVSRIKKREHDVFDDVKDKVLETLYDLEDDVVLITASPGMGKSTLLSHLSLKTKEIDPKVWIVRINLLEHARIFSKWQDDKTVISNLESLKFMCQAALSEESNESYKERDEVLIELEESSNGTVTLKKCSGGTSIEFQLKMFLDFYNRGKLIFLFDGFDEIFPHYEREALLLLKSVRSYSRKHRAWITSRSFNYVKSILEQEFGLSYEIEHFTCPEQDIYFNTFWKSKIQFKNLNMEQMRNVHDFLHFMQDLLPNERYRLFSLLELNPYFKVYLNFLDFIKLESVVNGIDITYHGYNNFLARFEINKCTCEANDLTAPPLHLYLLAECFHNKIKDVEEGDKDWDIDVTGFIFYEYYFETKIKKIRFQEKNKIDIYNPDNKMTYEKERADSVAKHKKLGAYAIFYPHVEVFEEAVLKEIEETINELSNAKEKTGLIRGVANNIPLFVHRSFAEYFAVEYICDLLKNDNNKIQKKLWNCILKVMFVKCGMNVFDIFNTKIKMDETLINVVERSKDYIDTLLSEEICDIKGDSFTWLDQYRTDRITFSMFSSLCDSIDMNDDTYDFEQFFSSMFHRASQDCDSFSLMELSNKLHLGSVNKNAKRNQKTNYMFLRIRGSVLFYQGLQAPRMRNLLKKKTAQNLVPSKR